MEACFMKFILSQQYTQRIDKCQWTTAVHEKKNNVPVYCMFQFIRILPCESNDFQTLSLFQIWSKTN